MPQVSVIIPSYNHEVFVEECIESVLQQTFQDFEIIITDDCSTDGTVQRIEKFTDPRIKLFRQSENQGACVAANNCLKHSQGQYIAMLSSDDVWLPEKLQVQVDYLNSHKDIAAVFAKVVWIDEESDPITDPNFPYYQVFNVQNRSRFEWLNHFFSYGNSLCHPSSLIRRDCYEAVGWLNPTMANLPDFDLWVRLCLKYDIHILDQNLIKFRRLMDEANASGDTRTNRIRTRYEHFRILDHYRRIQNIEDFYKVFPEIELSDDLTNDDLPFLLAKKALDSHLEIKQLWGLNLLYDQLQDEERAAKIANKFHYSYNDFSREVASLDIFNITVGYVDRSVYQKFVDGKAGNQEADEQAVKQMLLEDMGKSPSAVASGVVPVLANSQATGLFAQIQLKIRSFRRRLSLEKNIKLIQGTGYFDTTWYLDRYPDVKQNRIEPVKHYLLYGGFEGRDPSEKFSSSWYLAAYEDVRRSGLNPLVHYLSCGRSENRRPKTTPS